MFSLLHSKNQRHLVKSKHLTTLVKNPVSCRGKLQSQADSTQFVFSVGCLYFVWNNRGFTMPANTLGSWEAMTSDIISGNSTFKASAWMKVLRQNRLTFFTICQGRWKKKHLYQCWCLLKPQMICTSLPAYIMHCIHQFGQVVEALGAGHHTLLLQVDRPGKLSYVVLSHFLKRSLTFESFKRH